MFSMRIRIPSFSLRFQVLLCALIVINCRAEEKSDKTAPPRYENRSEHDPNGIGKFYLGREIAHFMSHRGADS